MAEEKQSTKKEGNIAVILIRGLVNVPHPIKDALFLLRLRRKFTCIVIQNNPVNRGSLNKCKDYITWGEIDADTEKLLQEKRGRKTKDKEGKEKDVPFYRLHPPRKGFERKGIKTTYKSGGVLGNRGEKINELLQRMI